MVSLSLSHSINQLTIHEPPIPGSWLTTHGHEDLRHQLAKYVCPLTLQVFFIVPNQHSLFLVRNLPYNSKNSPHYRCQRSRHGVGCSQDPQHSVDTESLWGWSMLISAQSCWGLNRFRRSLSQGQPGLPMSKVEEYTVVLLEPGVPKLFRWIDIQIPDCSLLYLPQHDSLKQTALP